MASPKKIVIIGGGMSGLAAAFGLTSAPNWQRQYEITVLQLGWRLGGKGAGGRNQELQQRIEERGLHVWGGFYENAFRVMRACYTEMKRPPNMPLATWDEAFKPCPLVSWMEDLSDGWLAWNNVFPEYSSTPGDGTPMPSIFEGILHLLEWIIQTAATPSLASSPTAVADSQSAAHFANSNKPSWVASVISKAEAAFDLDSGCHPALGHVLADTGHPSAIQFLIQSYKVLKTAPANPKDQPKEIHEATSWLLDAFRTSFRRLTADADPSDNGIRRSLILIDLGIAEIVGILNDGVLANGFDCIDNQDLMAWFAQNGATPDSVNSALVRGTYDFIFAYENGDPTKPALAAGAGLRCIFRLLMWYKGAIFWKMQAGIGDTVFAPLYQVLQKRGVNFKFFQKVKNLGLDPAKSFVQTIEVEEQATLINGPYRPLYDVNNLPCWPNQPFFDQLVQGQQLQQEGIDLEDPWADWSPANIYTLQAGKDFDTVILATSFAPLSEICTELIDANTDWANMVQNIQTVQTQAFQLWMTPSLSDLGWTEGSTVLTGFAHPDETWADMSQVIPREMWPAGQEPGSIAYFCGPLPGVHPIPPYSDHNFPARQAAIVRQDSINWINANLPSLWPAAGSPEGFNWNLLDDPKGGIGQTRFSSQYWRANLSPAERYVLSVPGSTQYRLGPAKSGFGNLYLAGDWTLNGLNFGCIESAAMGGLEVSKAICGYPQEIVGESDF